MNREAFEAWAEAHSYYLDKDSEGKYVKNTTAMAWQIWRAAKKTPPLDFSKSQIGNYAAAEVILTMWANGMESEAQSLADCFYGLVDANAALASQAHQPYDHDLGSVLMALENAISELKGIIHNDNLKPYIAAKDKLIAYISTPESKEYWCGTCEQNVDKGCGDSACQWRYKLPPAPMNEVNKPEGDKK